jgi:hypothetical protein
VVTAVSWPKAIHEGNGTVQWFLTKNMSEEQKKAVITIFSGQAKGDGPFALFAPTYKYILEPQSVESYIKTYDQESYEVKVEEDTFKIEA